MAVSSSVNITRRDWHYYKNVKYYLKMYQAWLDPYGASLNGPLTTAKLFLDLAKSADVQQKSSCISSSDPIHHDFS
jgi:hypothetical protein